MDGDGTGKRVAGHFHFFDQQMLGDLNDHRFGRFVLSCHDGFFTLTVPRFLGSLKS